MVQVTEVEEEVINVKDGEKEDVNHEMMLQDDQDIDIQQQHWLEWQRWR